MHGDYLGHGLPAAPPPAALVVRRQTVPAPARTNEPIREPYVGTCDSPYDRMRRAAMWG